jgi:NAD(P)H-hydrate epimerase
LTGTQRLSTQLKNLNIPFTDDFPTALKETDHIVDAIFGLSSHPSPSPPTNILGFSFSGEVREPFPAVIRAFEETRIPVTSVDAPSSWNIEEGPPKEGPGAKFNPEVLVSLTAPKPLVKYFKGRHFIGGR